ncbi:MAG: DUF2207 domain-containing protein [Acidimicrobiia bacterium]|nr:DUF2207 domain-containing protein [Acidimicrobiia bacterium]
MTVVEHITYEFHGSFSYGTRPIPIGAYAIEDVSVSEAGTPLPFVGAPHNIQWSFSAQDETRTFDIAYTVRGAVPVGSDVAEVYWKWVGEDHPSIDRVTATLVLPEGATDVRGWGHGPLQGVVTVDGATVRWEAADVPEGSFVEGRVTLAASALDVPSGGGPRLGRILAEEEAWAAAANREREEAREAEERREALRDVATVVLPILTLASAAGFLLVWRRWGEEPPPPTDVGEYVRDLPDDPPAVVDALLHWGTVRPLALSATFVDLAQRGYLDIAEQRVDRAFLPDKVDFAFTWKGRSTEELAPYERKALEKLFRGQATASQSDLVAWARSHPSSAQSFWRAFRRSVSADLRRRRYLQGGRGLPFALGVGSGALLALAALGGLLVEAWVPAGVALAWATVQLALTPLLRQRTAAGARRVAEWRGVQRFLRDFSELEEAPAGHLVLWERYLVYAVALGVSEELVRGLALRVPEAAADTGFVHWYHGSYGGTRFGSIGSFGTSFGATAVSSFTPASSGSGGGGGFSGGGGGGGGGGGIGAG